MMLKDEEVEYHNEISESKNTSSKFLAGSSLRKSTVGQEDRCREDA